MSTIEIKRLTHLSPKGSITNVNELVRVVPANQIKAKRINIIKSPIKIKRVAPVKKLVALQPLVKAVNLKPLIPVIPLQKISPVNYFPNAAFRNAPNTSPFFDLNSVTGSDNDSLKQDNLSDNLKEKDERNLNSAVELIERANKNRKRKYCITNEPCMCAVCLISTFLWLCLLGFFAALMTFYLIQRNQGFLN